MQRFGSCTGIPLMLSIYRSAAAHHILRKFHTHNNIGSVDEVRFAVAAQLPSLDMGANSCLYVVDLSRCRALDVYGISTVSLPRALFLVEAPLLRTVGAVWSGLRNVLAGAS